MSAAVEARFGLDAAWLAEHRRELQARRIVSPVSRKVRLYSVARLRRLIEPQAESVGDTLSRRDTAVSPNRLREGGDEMDDTRRGPGDAAARHWGTDAARSAARA